MMADESATSSCTILTIWDSTIPAAARSAELPPKFVVNANWNARKEKKMIQACVFGRKVQKKVGLFKAANFPQNRVRPLQNEIRRCALEL